ncbi:MAG: hypothetical protein QOH12_1299 [Solirubrobacteraceae bacterium]|jgi:hypothetical protein|nr:hypothetical protein [Solirubrobacteraceae bacterium]
MNGYEDWLAAMPVADVKRQLSELERKADVLRVLLAQRNNATITPPPVKTLGHRPSTMRGHGRRDKILKALRGHVNGLTTAEIAAAAGNGPEDMNSVLTALSRMSTAGIIERVHKGRYRLPPNPATDALAFTPNGDERSASNEE